MNHLSDQSRLYITKFIPLQSNRFPINQILKYFRCLVEICLETRTLSYDKIPDKRVVRRDLILHLNNLGLQNNEIADFLNTKGIKKPRGTTYQTKDIWSAIKKWNDREKRLNDTKVVSLEIHSVILIK